jgi:hypothetical protein
MTLKVMTEQGWKYYGEVVDVKVDMLEYVAGEPVDDGKPVIDGGFRVHGEGKGSTYALYQASNTYGSFSEGTLYPFMEINTSNSTPVVVVCNLAYLLNEDGKAGLVGRGI